MQSKKFINYSIKIFWVYLIGCLAGWLIETCFVFFTTGSLESRQSLIYGPFIQVYGIGALMFYMVLPKMKSNFIIFFIAAILGGAVEYFYSFFQEYLFKTVSWDYTNHLLNIHGRTSLLYCLAWGILGVFFIKMVYPKLTIMDNLLDKVSFKYATTFLVLFMVFNITISGLAGYRQKERIEHISARSNIDVFLDNYYSDYVMSRIYSNKIQK